MDMHVQLKLDLFNNDTVIIYQNFKQFDLYVNNVVYTIRPIKLLEFFDILFKLVNVNTTCIFSSVYYYFLTENEIEQIYFKATLKKIIFKFVFKYSCIKSYEPFGKHYDIPMELFEFYNYYSNFKDIVCIDFVYEYRQCLFRINETKWIYVETLFDHMLFDNLYNIHPECIDKLRFMSTETSPKKLMEYLSNLYSVKIYILK